MRPETAAGLMAWAVVAVLIVCALLVAVAVGGLVVDAIERIGSLGVLR